MSENKKDVQFNNKGRQYDNKVVQWACKEGLIKKYDNQDVDNYNKV